MKQDEHADPGGPNVHVLKVIAFIDEKPVIERILGHLGLPTTGPPIAPARVPALAEAPLWQDDVPELQQSLR